MAYGVALLSLEGVRGNLVGGFGSLVADIWANAHRRTFLSGIGHLRDHSAGYPVGTYGQR